MIEHGRVDGQPAVLSYVNDQFEPVDKINATLLVASLADGRKLFLKVPEWTHNEGRRDIYRLLWPLL